jgi:protein phosphatase
MQDHVVVDLLSDDPQVGDIYLLCSDGLSGMIVDEEILDILTSTNDAPEVCRRLIERANENGGEDNITALVIRFDDREEDPATISPPPDSKSNVAREVVNVGANANKA